MITNKLSLQKAKKTLKICLFLPFIFFGLIFSNKANANDYYWVGGTGNWSDYANHWATTSGGSTFHISPPAPSDNVFFDAGSFSASGQTATLDQPTAFCKNFSWMGTVAGSDLAASNITYKISIMGSIEIDVNTDLSFDGILSFESTLTGNTVAITDTVECILEFNSPGADWTLSDQLHVKNEIHLKQGTLNTNSFPFSCIKFISNYGTAGRALIPGNSEIRIINYTYGPGMPASAWNIDELLSLNASNNDLIFTSAYPTYNLSSPGLSSFTLNSGNQDYRNIYVRGLGYVINGPDTSIVGIDMSASFKRMSVQKIRIDHCTNVVFNSDFFLQADSITTTGAIPDLGIPTVNLILWDTSYINYVNGGGIIISTGIYNIFGKVNASYSLVLTTYTLPTPIYNVNTFEDVFVGGNFTESNSSNQGLNPSIYHKCVIMGDGTFHSHNAIFDTLMLNEGKTYTIDSGDTVTTNNQFIAFGAAALPIQLHSSTTGTQAKMIFNQNDVCSDYLYLRDMNAIGTNVVAGANSQNIANNTGWQFTPCSVVSNVWPGDADYSLIVNNFDLLNIGLAFGETGPSRAGASNNYTAQPATDWNGFFITAVNKKHADCDGNGTVNADDTVAVVQNYGLTHPARLSTPGNQSTTGVPLSFDMPSGSITPGSSVSVPINFGTSSYPADNVYGIAFTINYDPAFMQAGSMYLEYTGSWLATPSNYINVEKEFSAAGSFEAGICRINHQNVSGYGMIAVLHFTVANSASGLLTLSFSDVLAISNNELQIPVNPLPGSVLTGIDEISTENGFALYPNPVSSQLTVHSAQKINQVKISDLTGRIVFKEESEPGNKMFNVQIDVSAFSTGIYFLSMEAGEKTFIKKVMIK